MASLSDAFGARTVRMMVNVVQDDVSGLECMVEYGGGREHKEMIMRFNLSCKLLVS